MDPSDERPVSAPKSGVCRVPGRQVACRLGPCDSHEPTVDAVIDGLHEVAQRTLNGPRNADALAGKELCELSFRME